MVLFLLTAVERWNNITGVMSDEKISETKINIINAAKKEFLENGYKDASLRHICKSAGVTTGALYFFFKNKEELLDTILGPLIEGYKKLVRSLFTKDGSGESQNGDSMMIEYLYKNREAAIILIDCCRGTKYETLLGTIYSGMKHGFESMFRAGGIDDVDGKLVEILASMKMKGYLNLLKSDYGTCELKKIAQSLGAYWDSGFFALVNVLKKK